MELLRSRHLGACLMNGRIISQSMRMEHDDVQSKFSTINDIYEKVEEKEVIGHASLGSKGVYMVRHFHSFFLNVYKRVFHEIPCSYFHVTSTMTTNETIVSKAS